MEGEYVPFTKDGFNATPPPPPADVGEPNDSDAVAPAFTAVDEVRYAVNVLVPSVNVNNELLFSVVLAVPTFLTCRVKVRFGQPDPFGTAIGLSVPPTYCRFGPAKAVKLPESRPTALRSVAVREAVTAVELEGAVRITWAWPDALVTAVLEESFPAVVVKAIVRFARGEPPRVSVAVNVTWLVPSAGALAGACVSAKAYSVTVSRPYAVPLYPPEQFAPVRPSN